MTGRTFKLLVVTPRFCKWGGTERAVVEEVNHFPCEWSITLLTSFYRPSDVPQGVRVVSLAIPSFPGILAYLSFFAASTIWISWQLLRGRRFDAIFSPGINCWPVTVAMSHYARKFFSREVWISGPWRFTIVLRSLNRIGHQALVFLCEWFGYRYGTRKIVCVSNRLAEKLCGCYGLKRERLSVVHHGVNAREFTPDQVLALRQGSRRKFGFDERKQVVLFIGNGLRTKGFPELVRALEWLRSDHDFVLAAVTNDEITPYEHLKWIRFFKPQEQVLEYYAAADLFVLPSIFDSFALPVLEAMACGIPVAVGSGAGVSELLHDGTDALIINRPSEIHEIAQSVKALLTDPALRNRLRIEGRKTAERLNWESHTRWLSEILLSFASHG